MSEAPEDQSLHQGPLHGAGQQVEGGAAARKLLRQAPPTLTLNHDVSPEEEEEDEEEEEKEEGSVRVCGEVSSDYYTKNSSEILV